MSTTALTPERLDVIEDMAKAGIGANPGTTIELITAAKATAVLVEAWMKVTTAVRRDTSLSLPDPLLEFIVAVADAAIKDAGVK